MGLIRWQSGVDFLVLAFSLYWLLRWSREARALRLALGILALRVGALLATQLDLVITGWVLDASTIVAVLTLLIVFQPDLRRALMRLDLTGRARHGAALPVAAAVGEAAWSLARARTGALIVLVRRDSIAELVSPGVALGARVSPELLGAIFQKGSAMHDGAVIIEGDAVARAGAVLPLTQRPNVPGQFGTRHRAAMGLADRCDAAIVVVSEERGEVTLMYGNVVRLMASEDDLTAAIGALTGEPERRGVRSRWPLRPADLTLQAAAVALAALVWMLTFLFPGASVRVESVPVEFTNVPAGLSVTSQSADTIEVWLRGSDFIFDSVNLESLVARCDLSSARAGLNTLRVRPDMLQAPPGLRVGSLAPAEITVRLDK